MHVMVAARTVAHLRPAQVLDRLTRGLRPIPPPELARYELRSGGGAQVPARGETGSFDGRSFTLLNRSIPFAGEDRWRPAAASDLWAYTLHYFRYLWSVPAEAGLALMTDWIAANPPGSSPGWDPYPISLRLREWIEWLHDHPDVPHEKRSAILASAAHQAAVLASRPELHLLGNHLLENAISLCWAGASLDGPGSDRWLARGASLLASELATQVLADGAHEERSPMYQALLAEALLRLHAVAGRRSSAIAMEVARVAGEAGGRLLSSLGSLMHPDGEFALLNDCALGVAPTPASLRERFPSAVATSGRERDSLPDAGYLTARRDGEFFLVFDAGPIGPEHQPGHGHADTLGFELSIGGQRMITDTGVTTYAPGAARAYDRSTAAHSTVGVDGMDHAELWGSFRCGARPRLESCGRREEGSGTLLEGAYRARLRGGRHLRHQRRIRVQPGDITITDELACRGCHEAAVRFHLAPGVEPRLAGGGAELRHGNTIMAAIHPGDLDWRVEDTPYHPEFNVEIGRNTLVGTTRFEDHISLTSAIELLR
jgi:hypothetical protein